MPADGEEGILSPMQVPSPSRQRGFYSEVLDEQGASTFADSALCGPKKAALQPKLAVPRQRIPAGSCCTSLNPRRQRAAPAVAYRLPSAPAARGALSVLPLPSRLLTRARASAAASLFESSTADASHAAIARRARLGVSAAENGHAAAPPGKALEPKVLVPFKPGAGKTPRKIVIERQKRLFHAQDLQQLLLEAGVDMRNPDPPSALALETFDDTEYESRPPLEWMGLAVDGEGEMP
jgi:hypothetical protein